MILLVIFALLAAFAAWFVIRLVDTLRNRLAPDIATPSSALPEIYKNLKLKPGDKMYEPGCGDARVLRYCAKQQPKANYVGVENGILQFVKAKWACRGIPNIRIEFSDFRKFGYSDATHMYIYLLPEGLAAFTDRIPKKCQIVSCQFQLPSKKPVRTVLLKPASRLAKNLYVYK